MVLSSCLDQPLNGLRVARIQSRRIQIRNALASRSRRGTRPDKRLSSIARAFHSRPAVPFHFRAPDRLGQWSPNLAAAAAADGSGIRHVQTLSLRLLRRRAPLIVIRPIGGVVSWHRAPDQRARRSAECRSPGAFCCEPAEEHCLISILDVGLKCHSGKPRRSAVDAYERLRLVAIFTCATTCENELFFRSELAI
jgi:hypothetical protein